MKACVRHVHRKQASQRRDGERRRVRLQPLPLKCSNSATTNRARAKFKVLTWS